MFSTSVLLVGSLFLLFSGSLLVVLAVTSFAVVLVAVGTTLLAVVSTLVGFSLVVTLEDVVTLSSLALAWLSLAITGNNVAAAKAGISTYLILFFFIFSSYFK